MMQRLLCVVRRDGTLNVGDEESRDCVLCEITRATVCWARLHLKMYSFVRDYCQSNTRGGSALLASLVMSQLKSYLVWIHENE